MVKVCQFYAVYTADDRVRPFTCIYMTLTAYVLEISQNYCAILVQPGELNVVPYAAIFIDSTL